MENGHANGRQLGTITPHLIIRGAAQAITFYQQAFGAEELCRMPSPDGKVLWHAELQIGTSRLFLCDEFPDMGSRSPQSLGGTPVTIHLQVDNADTAFQKAVSAGATILTPLQNMFWGDRYGRLRDPFGHEWSIAQRLEHVPAETLQQRAAEHCTGASQ
jgi:uncharacterized glyoxalase superfamily protein PhnB